MGPTPPRRDEHRRKSIYDEIIIIFPKSGAKYSRKSEIPEVFPATEEFNPSSYYSRLHGDGDHLLKKCRDY
jgi:hypothetical protein